MSKSLLTSRNFTERAERYSPFLARIAVRFGLDPLYTLKYAVSFEKKASRY